MSGIQGLKISTATAPALAGTQYVPVLDTSPTIAGFSPEQGPAASLVALSALSTYFSTGGGLSTLVLTTSSADAVAVGPTGATQPTFQVDASTASQTGGVVITGSDDIVASVAIAATSSSPDMGIAIDPQGNGGVDIGQRAGGTGPVTIGTNLGRVLINGLNNNVMSTDTAAFTVGASILGAHPAFAVDCSAASQVAGLKVTGASTGGTVALSCTDSGATTNLSIDPKGAATVTIGGATTNSAVQIAKSDGKLGFFGATPIVRALLATGAGHTVDDVIAFLQNYGMARQS